MRTLDDVYGAELDGFPLEQEAHPFHLRGHLQLDWSDAANDPSYVPVAWAGDVAPEPGARTR